MFHKHKTDFKNCKIRFSVRKLVYYLFYCFMGKAVKHNKQEKLLQEKKILIIDDELRRIELIRKIVEGHGATAVTSNDGYEALKIIETHSLDLITTILRPTFGGINIIKEIKERALSTPLLVLSNWWSKNFLETRSELGVIECIRLPFTLEDLTKTIEKALKPTILRDKNILIVDDELGPRESISMIVRGHGATAVTANDNYEALKILDTHSFDLITTDLHRPGGSGIDFIKEIRARGLSTPIIVITGYGSLGTITTASKYGVYDYISKPFTVADITSVFNNALESKLFQGKKILIVEDDLSTVECIRMILEGQELLSLPLKMDIKLLKF